MFERTQFERQVRRDRRQRTRNIQGVIFRRWMGEGWIGPGGILVQQVGTGDRAWRVAMGVQDADRILAYGRTMTQAVEAATTVWTCDTCGVTRRGRENLEGQPHALCPEADPGQRGYWRMLPGNTPVVMEEHIRLGDRVMDDYLGEGTVVQVIAEGIFYLVRFDLTPPFEFNLGQNPTLAGEELARSGPMVEPGD